MWRPTPTTFPELSNHFFDLGRVPHPVLPTLEVLRGAPRFKVPYLRMQGTPSVECLTSIDFYLTRDVRQRHTGIVEQLTAGLDPRSILAFRRRRRY